jgi:hypothetical protein
MLLFFKQVPADREGHLFAAPGCSLLFKVVHAFFIHASIPSPRQCRRCLKGLSQCLKLTLFCIFLKDIAV